MTGLSPAVPVDQASLHRSPYKELASFDEQDTELFFGRTAERRLCLANLRANRLTVLYAPSGVGKTSLLAAGVIPDLKRKAFERDATDGVPASWPILARTWTDDPMISLE